MTIPSAPAPSPATSRAPGGAAREKEAAPTSPFELLLPAEENEPKAAPAATDDEPHEDKPDDKAAPSPTEQTNLAALLYTLPAMTAPPLPTEPTAPTGPPLGNVVVGMDDSASAAPLGLVDGTANLAKADPVGAADFAAPQKPVANSAEIPPANSSAATVVPASIRGAIPISETPANADVYLDSEPNDAGKKSRGTSGAKPAVSMNEASAINQNSHKDAPAARSMAAGLIASVASLADELPGQSQDSAQNSAPTDEWNANGGNAFAAPLAPAAREVGASFIPTPVKPIPAAAVVDEIGLGLDRIQERGNNRIDLRLSLEGGGQVSIALQLRDGAVHTSIQTGSTELRQALQQSWAQLSSRSEGLGLALAAPTFTSPTETSADAGQQNFRGSHDEPQPQSDSTPTFHPAGQQPKRTTQAAIPARQASGGLNVWA